MDPVAAPAAALGVGPVAAPAVALRMGEVVAVAAVALDSRAAGAAGTADIRVPAGTVMVLRRAGV
ncbi:MAG TPA: hypothetical protein VGV09_16935, partial [Steroidobacteraceae bacterium]|nr:hypothetical protein [Steroidobacteraceae bacterium]